MPSSSCDSLNPNQYLDIFLRKHYFKKTSVNKDEKSTHTKMSGGTFKIPDEKLEEFFQLYSSAVKDGSADLCLTEMNRELTPIKIDLDFRYMADTLDRRYKIDHICTFVSSYLVEIERWVNFDVVTDPDYLQQMKYAFVMEKTAPSWKNQEGGEAKDGIHIMFPFVVLEPAIQHKIRENVYKGVKEAFHDMQLTNSPADIVDRQVIEHNAWLMYGSKKPSSVSPYKLTHIITRKPDGTIGPISQDIVDAYSLDQLIRILSIRSHYADPSPIHIGMQDEVKGLNKQHQLKKNIRIKKLQAKRIPLKDSELKIVRDIVKLLNPSRASNRPNWIEVGWCLHNIDDRLLQDWIQFSQLDTNYVDTAEEDCTNEWANMEFGTLSQGSLRHWAKTDDPEGYTTILQEEVKQNVMQSISNPFHSGDEQIDDIMEKMKISETDVARVVHGMYKHEFVCVDPKRNRYYQFSNHRYREINGSIILRQRLSNEVFKVYKSYLNKQIDELTNASQYSKKDKKVKKMLGIMSSLSTTRFKNNVMTECLELFYDPNGRSQDFVTRLDENHNLLGCENGVFDLQKMEFRDGNPDDFIAFSTKNNYIQHNWDDPIIKEIMGFLTTVFPQEALRKYVLKLLASFLNGANPNEKFWIFEGVGSNGKSKIIELFELAIGDYAGKLPISLLTKKRGDSGNATPELARTKGLRFVVMQEPDQHTKINVGLMKELTGGDRITVRALYEMPFEFKPQFKMVLTCNHLPDLPHDDEGTWRRIRSVQFQSKFVDAAQVDPSKHYYKKDEALAKKLVDWKEGFLWMLLETYKTEFKKSLGFTEPECVTKATRQYQNNQDILFDFVESHVREDVPNSVIRFRDMYDHYKEWHIDNNIAGKPKSNKVIKEYFTKLWGPPVKVQKFVVWKNKKLKLDEADESDGEELDEAHEVDNTVKSIMTEGL